MAVPQRNCVVLETIIPGESEVLNAAFMKCLIERLRSQVSATEESHLGVLFKEVNSTSMDKISTNTMSSLFQEWSLDLERDYSCLSIVTYFPAVSWTRPMIVDADPQLHFPASDAVLQWHFSASTSDPQMTFQSSILLFLALKQPSSNLMQNLDCISLHRRGLAAQIIQPSIRIAASLFGRAERSRTRTTTRSYLSACF